MLRGCVFVTFSLAWWIGGSWGYSGTPDNEGVEFIFAFGSNHLNSGGSLEVFITTRKSWNVTFNYTTQGGHIEYGYVTASEIFSYSLNDTYRMSPNQGTTIESKAQIIQADDEIIVYASNKQSNSADGFLVLPTDIQTNEYYVPCWASAYRYGGSMIIVVAIEDGTTFNITHQGSTTVSNTAINRGQAFQFLGAKSANDDLTGARILSDKPVSVLSGNQRTFLGMTSGSSDHIVEMIPPINTLGSKFLMANFYERKSDIVRVIAAKDNITVAINRSSQVTVQTVVLTTAGEFAEITTAVDEVIYVETTGACIMAQYCKTASADNAESDPMMALVPPIEQYGNFYTFATPSGVSASYRNYVNIIMKSDTIDGFLLDDAAVNNSFGDYGFNVGDSFDVSCWAQDEWKAISNTGYSARTLAVLHGTHSIYHTNPTVSFSALMYGQVKFESYGFPAGSRFASIGAYCSITTMTASDGLDNDCDGTIDEELFNGIDDDEDGLTDEDCSANQFYVVPTTAATEPATTTESSTTTTTTESPTTTTTTKSPTTTATTDSPTSTAATSQQTTRIQETTSTSISAINPATVPTVHLPATTPQQTTSASANNIAITPNINMQSDTTTTSTAQTQNSNDVEFGTTTMNTALLAAINERSVGDDDLVIGLTVPVALAMVAAIVAGFIYMVVAKRRRRPKDEDEYLEDYEDELDEEGNKRNKSSLSSSGSDTALPTSPNPSTSTTSTYMNESLTTQMMKQKQLSGLSNGYDRGDLSPVDPVCTRILGDTASKKQTLASRFTQKIEW